MVSRRPADTLRVVAGRVSGHRVNDVARPISEDARRIGRRIRSSFRPLPALITMGGSYARNFAHAEFNTRVVQPSSKVVTPKTRSRQWFRTAPVYMRAVSNPGFRPAEPTAGALVGGTRSTTGRPAGFGSS